MASSNEDRERQVVPRLRNFDVAVDMGELSPLRPLPENPFTAEMLKNAVGDWHLTPNLSVAADLVSVAVTLGQQGAARDAARFILGYNNAPPSVRRIAAFCLGEATSAEIITSHDAGTLDANDLHSQIHLLRAKIYRYSRNPILWVNLARLYTSLAQWKQACRAARIALSMSPDNRFVLRSVSRLFLHQREGDLAHAILKRSPAIKSDPWILAGEVATASAIGRLSDNLKLAEKILQAGKVAPAHLSELASAVGTLEAMYGNGKRAKKLVRFSLERPSENAVAQAAWLSRKTIGLIMLQTERPTQSFEANTSIARQLGRWDAAVQQAKRWQYDQPFSSRPAMEGSYIASRVERYDEAIRIAELGLLSNPGEPILLNNLAFSAAQSGRLREARQTLKKLEGCDLPIVRRIFAIATSGLIMFRENNPLEGRKLYLQAASIAEQNGQLRAAISAKLYLAIEELRARTPDAERLKNEALASAAALTMPEDRVLVERLQKFSIVNPELVRR